MIGSTHSLSGAVAFAAVAVPLSQHVHHLTPATAMVGAVVAAGAAMLPDLDHPRGTIANTFGPISRTLCRVVAWLSGGHRRATHSLVGTTIATALAAAASHNPWAVTTLIWLCIGLADRALWQRPPNRPNGRLDWPDVAGLAHAAAAFGLAYLIVHTGTDLTVIPWAVAIGYLTHLLGDSMTEAGVPILWPFRARFRIATINTGEAVEKWVVVPALYASLGAIAYITHGQWGPALLHAINAIGGPQ